MDQGPGVGGPRPPGVPPRRPDEPPVIFHGNRRGPGRTIAVLVGLVVLVGAVVAAVVVLTGGEDDDDRAGSGGGPAAAGATGPPGEVVTLLDGTQEMASILGPDGGSYSVESSCTESDCLALRGAERTYVASLAEETPVVRAFTADGWIEGWEYTADDDEQIRPVIETEGRLVVMLGDVGGAGVAGLDAETGEQRWHVEESALLALHDGDVLLERYGDDEEPELVRVDARTGDELWTVSALIGEYAFGSGVAVEVGETTVGVIDLEDGSRPWGEPVAYDAIHAAVVGDVVVASDRARLTAWDLADGSVVWDRRLEEGLDVRSMGASGDTVVALAASTTHGIDPATGESRWSVGTGSLGYYEQGVVLGGKVFVPDEGARLTAVDLATGEVADAGELLIDGVVYATTTHVLVREGAGVAAVAPDALGTPEWTVDITGEVMSVAGIVTADGQRLTSYG